MTNAVYAAIGTVLGALIGGAVSLVKASNETELQRQQARLERDRLQAEIENSLREDFIEAYEIERERRISAEEREQDAIASREQYRQELQEVRSELREMRDELRALRLEHESVIARLEEDSDVTWHPKDNHA